MENIKATHGGRRPGAGRKKTPSRQLRDAIDNINVEEIVHNLKQWAKGKEVVCPHCNERTGCYTADTVALQSAIELLNRRLGKVPQSVQLGVTEMIQLDADQADKIWLEAVSKNRVLARAWEIAQREQLGPIIEGEARVLLPPVS